MSGKLFISYNHKDQPCAVKIKNRLVENGWEVWMDAAQMQAGENIEQFIFSGIRQTDITLTLVSANSLLSAWVAVETMATNLEEKLSSRRFIPCYIDTAFFDRSFTSKALSTIDENLQEIDSLMTAAIQKGWGIEDLQSERTRYLKLKAALPEIIGRLRNMLCIDLSGDQFEAGMQKILADLQPLRVATQPAITESKATVISQLTEKIATILDEGEKQRLRSLQNRLMQLQQLQTKYEEELDFETDPKRQMRYEREISNLKKSIEKVVTEIQSTNND